MAIDSNRVKEIFLQAAEQPDEAARAAYLDRTCGGDAVLRERVEALLRSHDPDGSFLGTPAVNAPGLNDGETQELSGAAPPMVAHETDEDLKFLDKPRRPDSLGRLGHYEILQVLGKGGFGIVFRAFDDILQRVVAIKVMAPQIATLSPARKRFLREAQSSAKVRHEYVVQIYEVAEQPLPYLTMEFIPGETLQQKLDRSGPLDVSEILRIGRQIAEGLAAAHACDLIHRDIKPGNILLEGGSHKAKITDFGLARAADDASISQSGIIAGTPMFMAPEQALGHKIDQRADLFSLGSVLYQMASGRPPFRAPSALAVLKRVAEEAPRPIPEIIPETPDWLCGIIAKLHAKNPDERFQSAREVADLLADCEAKLKAKQEVKNVLPAAAKPAGRKWVTAAAVLLLTMLALAVTEFAGVTQLFRWQATPDPMKQRGDLTQGPAAWRPLFNGKDFTGWRLPKDAPAGKYRIDTSEQEPFLSFTDAENLAVTETFGDYHLRLQFRKAGTEPMVAGVALLAAGQAGLSVVFNDSGPYLLGWGSRFQDAKFEGGRVIPGAALSGNERLPLPGDRLRAPGQWNDLEIVRHGDSGIVLLNGRPYAGFMGYRVEKTGAELGRAGLSFGAGRGTMHFRRIEIREIKAIPPEMAAKMDPLPPTFKNTFGMEFVKVPKGKSWLGGGKDKLGDQEVAIPADFYLGKYEVTQEEWTQVMGENPSHFSRTGPGNDAVKDISDADLKRFPVESVSWDQCQIFVAKLNQREKETGWVYRLPKEVEWEYACRGGPMADKADSAFDFYFAKPTNTLLPEKVNSNTLNRTCKVGSYEPSVLGLFDMHGNVWEWCDLDRPKKIRHQIHRGGGWNIDAGIGRVVDRGIAVPNYQIFSLGLRLARVPAGAPSSEVKTPPVAKQEPLLPTFK